MRMYWLIPLSLIFTIVYSLDAFSLSCLSACEGNDTRSVFLSCNGEGEYSGGNLSSCQSIAKAILKLKPVLVLNLLVQERAPVPVEQAVQELLLLAREAGVRVNVIKTKMRPGDYSRDSAVILGQTVALMPDLMGGVGAMREAIRQCNDLSSQDAFASSLSGIWSAYRYDVYRGRPEGASPGPANNYAEGGNVIEMPDGSLLVGSKQARPFPIHVSKFFAPKALVQIDLPEEMPVGHVDELFNFVENSSCGFKVLSASPRVLAKWLEREPKLAEVLHSRGPFSDEFQIAIDVAKDKIWEQIKPIAKCSKSEVFVDVPMAWNAQSRAVLSNPVNGIAINGDYVMPVTFAMDLLGNKADTVRIDRLELYLKSILIEKAGFKRVEMADTSYSDNLYFGTGGQVHCLTNQVRCPK